MELPPHARRILALTNNLIGVFGTTSACAENTPTRPAQNIRPRNYLRMRGEYPKTSPPKPRKPELPPHARRIPVEIAIPLATSGTTSACAENTTSSGLSPPAPRNYLRMRGEYCSQRTLVDPQEELPPHARRIRCGAFQNYDTVGTTSACAENTAGFPM